MSDIEIQYDPHISAEIPQKPISTVVTEMRGSNIKHADEYGGVEGFDPQKPTGIPVIIDPVGGDNEQFLVESLRGNNVKGLHDAAHYQPVIEQHKIAVDITTPASTHTSHIPIDTPPTIKVTFEMDGFGQLDAYYNDIVRSGSYLILCLAAGYQGPRFFPSTDKPLGIHVHRSNVIYKALTSGITFTHNGFDYCVLLIELEAPLGES